jgi:hypothetical protein
MPAEDVIVPLPFPRDRVPPAREVRSTLLCAALRALESRQLVDRYRTALDPGTQAEIFALTAGRWVPVELATAHYRACDHLGLDSGVVEDIGADVSHRVHRSIISVLVRLSREAGATPWHVFALVPKLNDFTWRGGAFEITRHGPKDARVEWYGQPCAAIEYYRTSFCGFVRGVLGLFCRRCYVRTVPARCGPTTLSVRVAWV